MSLPLEFISGDLYIIKNSAQQLFECIKFQFRWGREKCHVKEATAIKKIKKHIFFLQETT